jgi:UDP:flavonoid glycosyltransferase YjiC (YdhE family)
LALPQKVKFIDIVPAVVKANLFLTHSGNGSVLEAIHFKIPMLLFPLNNKWDQNGTAARVVHFGLGRKSELRIMRNELKFQLNSFLETNSA